MSVPFRQRLETHFPLHVLVREFDGVQALHEELMALLRAVRQRDAGTPHDAVHAGVCTTQGGFQTSGLRNFLDLDAPAVRQLRDALVLPAVAEYLREAFGANPALVDFRLFSWANLLRAGDWQAPHAHPTEYNVVSGVYYVQVPDKPEPQGWLEFLNPHPVSTMHGDLNSRRHAPRAGQLLLFPPWYMHFVHPFQGEGERAIVSFDVRLRPPREAG